jgi:hypothetical protein
MSKVAGLLVALLIAGIVTTRVHAAHDVCPGTTSSAVHGASH